jgi:hypothetical protein
MEEKRPKFAMTMAKIYIQQGTQKPLFGKPYIMTGSYWGVCGYLFQQCGLIGKQFSDGDIDSFIRVFAGQEGMEKSAFEYLSNMVSKEILPHINDITSFHELVAIREQNRVKFAGNSNDFFIKYGDQKFPQSNAAMLAAEWASYGGCLGLNYPEKITNLYESSNKPNSKWKEGYELGLVSTPEQPQISLEDAESEALSIFKEYCEEFYPELKSVLF